MRLYLTAFVLLVLVVHPVMSPLPAALIALKPILGSLFRTAAVSSIMQAGNQGAPGGGAGGGQTPAVDPNKIVGAINEADRKAEEILNNVMMSVQNKPNPLINEERFRKMAEDRSFKRLKAGTRTISLQRDKGFVGLANYQPAGWVVTETVSGPAAGLAQEMNEKMPTYTYPKGVGPVLMNGCTGQNYSETSPCHPSRLASYGKVICPNLLPAASYMGVGFDGRGSYKVESRRASLVQRYCGNRASFLGKDVPDIMNVFGIFETTAETKSFQSANEYMSYIRQKAGLSEQKNLFLGEASKHSESNGVGLNLGGIGEAIGSAVGGPIGSAIKQAASGSFNMGTGSGSGSSSSSQSGQSSSSYSQTESSKSQHSASRTFFAIMYVSITLYDITLDDVRPQDINMAALRDYMRLPASYFSVGADVKYQDFLLRWGTHFIRSGKFGGQLKITKTSKTDKIKSAQEFASIAETEFQSMFATLQSKYSQKKTKIGWLGLGGEETTTSQSSSAQQGSTSKSTMNQKNQMSQSIGKSEFTQTTVEAQGGTPEIAEALVDFYTPAFKHLYHRWIVSINDFVKPFEFQLKSIDQLFNMNMDELFPAGILDFGCMGTPGKKLEIFVEPGTNLRYHLDEQTQFEDNKTTTVLVKTYCKYKDLESFKTDLNRRRIALENAIAVYMVEGPFPTSSQELAGGQTGCEEKTLAQIDIQSNDTRPLSFSELRKTPFLIAFDLPREIPNLLKMQAKYTITYREKRWFATEPGHHMAHLYEGCELVGYKPTDHKICIWNIILTYEEDSGLFHVDPVDFHASWRRNPFLPDWLVGSTVASASRISVPGDSEAEAVPCNVNWMNSHRIDAREKVNCLHFTAASAGDIFIIFASVPRDHTTWYYLQANMYGVAYYKAMRLHKQDYQKGLGTLGDNNLYQMYFVCVSQSNGSVLMQYGKSSQKNDISTVYSAYKFPPDSEFSLLSFYTFGAGSKSVSLMDIYLKNEMPRVECLNPDYDLIDGSCILDCHHECIGCSYAKDDSNCFQCRNMRKETFIPQASSSRKIVKCLPECPVGHQPSDRIKNLCVPCPAGSFKNLNGNQNCTPCAPGTFSATEGATECQKCNAGTAAANQGSTSCKNCSSGSFAAQTGQAACTSCPVGQFNQVEGQTQCQYCAAGYFAALPGQTSCKACPSGLSSGVGAMSCGNNCKMGEFSPNRGATCRKCPAGSFSSSAGSSNCTLCPVGSFQPVEGQTNCTVAPPGSYVPVSGATFSTPCPMGTVNPASGRFNSSDCEPCAVGSFSSQPGSATCTPCPAGSFSPINGSSSCDECLPGTYSGEASAICSPCPAGSYSSRLGSSHCIECPPGTYSSTDGSAHCQKCNLDFALTRRSGMTHCDLCPDGGLPRSNNKCLRKAKVNCTIPSFLDDYNKESREESCKRTIDNDHSTHGGQRLYLAGRNGDGTVLKLFDSSLNGTLVYTLERPMVIRYILFRSAPGQCSKEIRNMRIYFREANRYQNIPVRGAKCTDYYKLYCFTYKKVKHVQIYLLNKRAFMFHPKINEIAFYGV